MTKEMFYEAIARKLRFTHIEKGHTYIVKDLVISKHPETGEWYNAVIYGRLDDGELFVRSEDSFMSNFSIVK